MSLYLDRGILGLRSLFCLRKELSANGTTFDSSSPEPVLSIIIYSKEGKSSKII